MIRGIATGLDEGRTTHLMEELCREAAAFRFDVAPNPCVGAALFAGDREVARGFHRFWGGPHAEVEALAAAAGSDVAPELWDLLVVTLEPCSSRGKTGPCVDAILAAGIPRVVVGALDPNPRHRGAGLERLRAGGVEVVLLEGTAPIERVAPHFARWTSSDRLRRPRPWTIAKWAQTRSGQLTPPDDVGEGRWISTAASLEEVAVLRGRVDAIVSGVGTVLADDPRFTVRPPGAVDAAPLRVVLDSCLRTPPDAALFRGPAPGEGAGAVHLLSLAGVGAARALDLEAAGASVHGLQGTESGGHVSLSAVEAWLWDAGVRRVLVEAGPTLLRAWLDAGAVDQVRVFTGAVNGGRGLSMGEWLGSAILDGRQERECGEDAVLEGFPRPV
ncbi:MAG: bifunctional diaminohydroxyphosphoribosylaminopyrimidine deaminase/5-amino-6-(5-phosphoribosylamino)uracil reductase RibD [Planctomycetota bacterium]|jgi:diaminohydroxyphosphoribosylaminopyrimidine deaminase/5-amino-6-(5-phosphoribosylamino)uracil reductase|nr:bifunctional diaminohydroxyphosphoribosylaminopyrimidine deaminase/5-amino-6-(5-phosphoribosylamino)uracil reductase RibD [Planctomycetota bacterium]MDP6764362.1 bifunctional diaminohydroxyphosphoribosylaminopyrimidine deaminase/5-amino-6-(5-phosphoribosylamino)uracil reductase RibD [Planctomycetota bacterium]MDP6988120.1 bifunctional diaminohydroxyphosphoribosylaminopyrimidine deaminase/5-amino-6-(5-phosphoribosylamino)uracil reductase RibD [Planctomycetota bacterium]